MALLVLVKGKLEQIAVVSFFEPDLRGFLKENLLKASSGPLGLDPLNYNRPQKTSHI